MSENQTQIDAVVQLMYSMRYQEDRMSMLLTMGLWAWVRMAQMDSMNVA